MRSMIELTAEAKLAGNVVKTINTADLFDRYKNAVDVCETQFRDFGMRRAFYGRCQTLRVVENHVPLRDVLATRGDGDVLIVDAGGSLRVGVLGDKIAALGAA